MRLQPEAAHAGRSGKRAHSSGGGSDTPLALCGRRCLEVLTGGEENQVPSARPGAHLHRSALGISAASRHCSRAVRWFAAGIIEVRRRLAISVIDSRRAFLRWRSPGNRNTPRALPGRRLRSSGLRQPRGSPASRRARTTLHTAPPPPRSTQLCQSVCATCVSSEPPPRDARRDTVPCRCKRGPQGARRAATS